MSDVSNLELSVFTQRSPENNRLVEDYNNEAITIEKHLREFKKCWEAVIEAYSSVSTALTGLSSAIDPFILNERSLAALKHTSQAQTANRDSLTTFQQVVEQGAGIYKSLVVNFQDVTASSLQEVFSSFSNVESQNTYDVFKRAGSERAQVRKSFLEGNGNTDYENKCVAYNEAVHGLYRRTAALHQCRDLVPIVAYSELMKAFKELANLGSVNRMSETDLQELLRKQESGKTELRAIITRPNTISTSQTVQLSAQGIRSGYLYRNYETNFWEEVYLTLKNDSLIFETPERSTMSLVTNDTVTTRCVICDAKPQYSFKIEQTRKMAISFQADTAEERDEWMAAINAAIVDTRTHATAEGPIDETAAQAVTNPKAHIEPSDGVQKLTQTMIIPCDVDFEGRPTYNVGFLGAYGFKGPHAPTLDTMTKQAEEGVVYFDAILMPNDLWMVRTDIEQSYAAKWRLRQLHLHDDSITNPGPMRFTLEAPNNRLCGLPMSDQSFVIELTFRNADDKKDFSELIKINQKDMSATNVHTPTHVHDAEFVAAGNAPTEHQTFNFPNSVVQEEASAVPIGPIASNTRNGGQELDEEASSTLIEDSTQTSHSTKREPTTAIANVYNRSLEPPQNAQAETYSGNIIYDLINVAVTSPNLVATSMSTEFMGAIQFPTHQPELDAIKDALHNDVGTAYFVRITATDLWLFNAQTPVGEGARLPLSHVMQEYQVGADDRYLGLSVTPIQKEGYCLQPSIQNHLLIFRFEVAGTLVPFMEMITNNKIQQLAAQPRSNQPYEKVAASDIIDAFPAPDDDFITDRQLNQLGPGYSIFLEGAVTMATENAQTILGKEIQIIEQLEDTEQYVCRAYITADNILLLDNEELSNPKRQVVVLASLPLNRVLSCRSGPATARWLAITISASPSSTDQVYIVMFATENMKFMEAVETARRHLKS